MSPQLAWHVARAAGLVAWALTAAAVIWGLLLSTRIAGRRPPPAWLSDLHRFLGGLAVTFTAVHIGALLADTWVHFDVIDVLIPFASSWRPAAVAWGVVALYLLAAVEVTSLLRRRVPTRWWRSVHMSSFALFVAGTIHLLAAGTDATSLWLQAAVAVAVTAVLYLTTVRLLTPRRRNKPTAHPPRPHRDARQADTNHPRPPAQRRAIQPAHTSRASRQPATPSAT